MNEEVNKAIREAMERYPESVKGYSEALLRSNQLINVGLEVSKIVDKKDQQLDERDRQLNWHLAVANAIRELLEMKDEFGNWYFKNQGHWCAVYEVLIEEKIIPNVSESQFISEYCSPDSPHCILPEDNDTLENPSRIGAPYKKDKPVDTAKLINRAKNKEKNDKGNLIYPKVPQYKITFRDLLVKHGAIK